MLTKSYPSFVAALAVALAAHLALLAFGQRMARRDLGWWIAIPRLAPPAAITPPNPDEQIGDIQSIGKSINRAPGDRPMQSSISDDQQEQAMMTSDPTGFNQTARQSTSAALQNQASEAAQSRVFASAESAEDAPQGPKSPKTDSKKPPQPDAMSAGPLKMDTVQTAEDQTTGPQATSRPQQDQQNAQSGQQASQQQTNDSPAEASQGKPLPSSDFESFPITTIASQMVDGRIEARGGRRMKTRREPDIGLAGWADLATMADPQVVLELKIDETGNVVDVQVLHTSGSDNVDLPCRRAAATWWMEPFIDPKTGKPHPQIVDFTISFR